MSDHCNFVSFCRLVKEPTDRASLQQLLYDHPFLVEHANAPTDVAGFVAEVLDNSSAADEVDPHRRGNAPAAAAAGPPLLRNGRM